MKPLVSIIVPVYNVGDYVLKCLDSLNDQTYENLEFIIIDDGSTDKSGEICDVFAKKEKRAKVFHKKNGGLSSARNFGIKKARGEYICLVDSDDWVQAEFVEKLVEAVEKDKADIAVCGYNKVVPETKVLTGKEATIKLLTQQENMEIIAWNKIYRRGLFEEISYPEGVNHEDNLTTYKLLSRASKVAYEAESLYEYVERVGSIMDKGKKKEKLEFRERAAREAIEYFDEDKDLKAAAEIALLTAKMAWVDFAISREVDKEYLDKNVAWVKKNKNKYLKNKYLSKKLKLYIYLVTNFGAKLYIGFRKVWHE
ncbi:glycosyltransferase [Candidatus Saccharibacteria bacterium]|nr:glycosyltransferase [Candidatus Saccharibacteria bacterium]